MDIDNTHTTPYILHLNADEPDFDQVYLGNQLYFGGEVGVAFAPHNNTSFYTPSLGLKFNSGLDIGVKYDNYSNYKILDAMSVKVGYHFKW